MLWQVSILNFLHYNVKGGGDSALYGVEPATFYLRNGLNNLNLVLPLAMAYPVVAVLHLLRVTGEQLKAVLARPAQLDADAAGCAPALLQRSAGDKEMLCLQAGWQDPSTSPPLSPASWVALFAPLASDRVACSDSIGSCFTSHSARSLALFGDCRRLSAIQPGVSMARQTASLFPPCRRRLRPQAGCGPELCICVAGGHLGSSA